MATDKRFILVQRLYEQTKAGRIPWEATARGNCFQAAFPGYAVQISHIEQTRVFSPGKTREYLLRVVDPAATIVEEISEQELAEALERERCVMERKEDTGGKEPIVEAYEMLEATYMGARRSALGAEQALDDLIEILGGSEAKE